MQNLLTTAQEMLFDLHDLIDSGEIDDIVISEFSEFETLREFMNDQLAKITKIERFLASAANAE